jgi:hypothetical protein
LIAEDGCLAKVEGSVHGAFKQFAAKFLGVDSRDPRAHATVLPGGIELFKPDIVQHTVQRVESPIAIHDVSGEQVSNRDSKQNKRRRDYLSRLTGNHSRLF